MPIGHQDDLVHRIMLSEMYFPYIDKLTKGQIAFTAQPTALTTLLSGGEGRLT